jgi:hypothetical protein
MKRNNTNVDRNDVTFLSDRVRRFLTKRLDAYLMKTIGTSNKVMLLYH